MGEFFSDNGDAGQQEYDSEMPDSETDLGNDGDSQGFEYDMQDYHIDLRNEGGSIPFVSLLIRQVIVSLNVTSRIASTNCSIAL
jgi:hypothetical protein